jgi:hypothetical protein
VSLEEQFEGQPKPTVWLTANALNQYWHHDPADPLLRLWIQRCAAIEAESMTRVTCCFSPPLRIPPNRRADVSSW